MVSMVLRQTLRDTSAWVIRFLNLVITFMKRNAI